MESIGFLVNNIIDRLKPIMESKIKSLSASGGSARRPLLQFIANLTGIPVTQSAMKDQTAYGVFRLLRSKNDNDDDYQISQTFSPQHDRAEIENKLSDWQETIESIL